MRIRFVIFFLLLFNGCVFSQIDKTGIIFGISKENLANAKGEYLTPFYGVNRHFGLESRGIFLGVSNVKHLWKMFDFQSNLTYHRADIANTFIYSDSYDYYNSIEACIMSNNIRLEELMRVSLKKILTIGVGLNANYLVYASSIINYGQQTRRFEHKYFNKFTLGYTFLLGFNFEDAEFNLKYSYGLTDKIKGDNTYKIYDKSIEIGFIQYIRRKE